MVGRTLGNYRITEQIGLGGMATVYKAYDPNTDRFVAIKILPQHFSNHPTFRERFQREARAVAKLEHMHILPIFAYGEEGGIAYMVMRYLQTGTLTDRIRQGPLSLADAARLLTQIAGALDHAHTHGILHRDIKPSNVLLDTGGNAFLTDFGIAKMVEGTVDLTAGGIIGTPAYMSPEQCRGNITLTPTSDQYSLGIVLYEMVTGRTPYQAETPIALIHMQLNEPLPLPRQIRPDLPGDAERVILKALSKAPESRYQNCGVMAAAFAQAVAAIPAPPPDDDRTLVSAPPSTLTTPRPADVTQPQTAVPAPSLHLPAWAAGAAAATLILVGLIAAAMWYFAGDRAVTQAEPPPASEQPAASQPTRPAATAASFVPVGQPPAQARLAEPCQYQDRGPGLCLYPLKEGEPKKLLADTTMNLAIGGRPGWSPDGQKLVFSARQPGEGDNAMYLINADGSGLQQLPRIKNDVAPAWSPNGEWLAFHSGSDLTIMRPNGSEYRVLIPAKKGLCAEDPQWSPDSRRIVVSMVMGGCPATPPFTRELWLVSENGEEIKPIASTTHSTMECYQAMVAFNPAGTAVAYVDESCRPWLINLDGGPAQALAEFPVWWLNAVYPQWGREAAPPPPPKPRPKIVEICPEQEPPHLCERNPQTGHSEPIAVKLEFGAISRPGWSPDGQQIVFDGGTGKKPDQKLYIINADGGGLTQVTRGDTNDLNAAWSPDGAWLVFHRNCELWKVRPNGRDETRLSPWREDFCAVAPAWSPGSDRVAFVNSPDPKLGRPQDIRVVNEDGRNETVIFTFETRVDVWDMAWSPDGAGLACWYYEKDQPRVLIIPADGSGEPEIIANENKMPEEWQISFWPRP
jgi:serine/threonine-protein kinase